MKELYICGHGFRIEQITLEVIDALKRSDIIFTGSIDPFFLKRYLNINTPVKSLFNKDNFDVRLVVDTIKESFKNYDRVAVLTYGNPIFAVSFSKRILEEIKNVNIKIFTGISTIDGFFHIFDLNEFDKKIVILSVSVIGQHIRRSLFDPDAHTLVIDIRNILKPVIEKDFIEVLSDIYGKKHILYIFHIPDQNNNKMIVKKIKLLNFSKDISPYRNIIDVFTLYIPPTNFNVKILKTMW